MLFNSWIYTAAFLPLAALAFYTLGQRSQNAAVTVLVGASLAFYAWWQIADLFWLCSSIVLNFVAGTAIARWRGSSGRAALGMLAASIAANLAILGYHKYVGFLAEILWVVLGLSADGTGYVRQTATLPLGISFFTFTQIAYLVDVYRREAERASFPDYALFVSYFPHVIAGPLLYHREMFPQFRRLPSPLDGARIAIGVTIFSIGLFKKVVLADGLVPHVSPIFEAATVVGRQISFAEGWIAAAGYTFQIYFDFSGYSDMAIGGSLIFGIKLPINFHSPYKATNIIDFWRCWHISLSRFLRHYLYIPLGGNRKGSLRRYVNLMVTMVLGGIWHGASWNFLLWGGLHGIYLMINHAWRAVARDRFAAVNPVIRWAGRAISWVLTFLAIILAWVFFRADTLRAAINVFQGMVGTGDRLAFPSHMFPIAGLLFGYLFLVLCLPNTQQVMHRVEAVFVTVRSGSISIIIPSIPLLWRPSMGWAALCAAMAAYAFMSIGQPSEFLYFQF